jgi:hypothetical protein
MSHLDGLIEQLFGDRRRTQIVYGEDAEASILTGQLDQSVVFTFDGTNYDATTQIQVCAGLFPLLIVMVDHVVQRDVPATEVVEYVRRQPELSHGYRVAFASKDAVTNSVQYLFNVRKPRMAVTIPHAHGLDFHMAINKGERLAFAYFGGEPIPDEQPLGLT